MTDETLRQGDRVLPSGAGRTAAWPKRPGTVTRRLSERTVEVQGDGTTFGDEMDLSELARLGGESDG